MRILTAIAGFATMLLVSVVDAKAEQVDDVVKRCVETVHRRTPDDPSDAKYYKQFDAYYNPATKRVMNNGPKAGAIYYFEKCMAEQGFPLGG